MPERRRGHGDGDYQRRDGTWIASKNEGLYQRADKLWIATFSYSDPTTGRTVRKTFSSTSRQEAKLKREAFKAQLGEGLSLDCATLTLGAYLDGWLPGIKRRRRAKTFRSYEQNVRLYIVPYLGHIRLRALTRRQVQGMLDEQRAKGLAPTTVTRTRDVLRKALNDAIADLLIKDNVATRVEVAPAAQTDIERDDTPEAKVPMLTIAEAHCFVEAADTHRLGALFIVALVIGARQGEALGLRWSDIDLTARTINIAVQMQRIEGMFHFVQVKSKSGRRTVRVPAVLVPVLEAHRARQRLEREVLGERWQDWGLVFCTSRGTPLDGPNVTRYLRRFLERSRLPRIDFHGLRHSCASILAALRVPLLETSHLLGHSDPRLTQRLYSHASAQTRQGPADAMDTMLDPPPS